MTDIERQVADSLERLYPVPVVTEEWEQVLARTPRKPRLMLRPATVRRKLALTFALAIGIAVALLASSLLRSSPTVLERAQAALDPNDRILHIVDRWGDGPEARNTEAWQLPDGSLDHVVSRSPSGAIATDCVFSETETRCWNPALDVVDVYQYPPPEAGLTPSPYMRYAADWPASLRRALGSGYARMLGTTTFEGRPVFAVLLAVIARPGPPRFDERLSDTLYLDRKTYLPVAEWMPAGSWTRHFDTFEFLPDTAANRKAVELPAPADARIVVHPNEYGPPEQKGK